MDKKSLLICVVLFIISFLVGYGAILVVDYVSYDDNDVVDNDDSNDYNEDVDNDDSNDYNEDVDSDDSDSLEEDNIDNESKPATEVYNKTIGYSGSYVSVVDEIIDFEENEKYKNKLLTLTVDNIVLDGEKYTFSLKNHPQHCAMDYNYMREGYNEFYINDKMIYSQYNQSCYLERVHYITVINNKYIGIAFEGQNGKYMKIYDKNIKLVDTLEYSDIDFEFGEIIYADKNDESKHFIYDIVDGKVQKREKINLDEIKESYTYGDLKLIFTGDKSSLINGEEKYEYTLDISLNGKKIDSSIFGNKNNKVIWSSNHAASFRVVDIDNYYILVSSIIMQNDGSYVLIIDKKGNVLKTFNDVDITIDEVKLEVEVTDCKSYDVDPDCSTNRYKLSKLK